MSLSSHQQNKSVKGVPRSQKGVKGVPPCSSVALRGSKGVKVFRSSLTTDH